MGKTPTNDSIDNNTKEIEIVVPLKYLSNFWRTLDMPLINCEINLILTWYENCVLADLIIQAAVDAKEDLPAKPAINAPTNATFNNSRHKIVCSSTYSFNPR